MKTTIFVLTAVMTLIAALPADAACNPNGYYQQDMRFYDHVRNGAPSTKVTGTNAPECWTISNESDGTTAGVWVSTDTSCGFSQKNFDFHGYNQSMQQTFAIPGTLTGTNWDLQYHLDFNDPNNDGTWNKLYVYVYNADTNALLTSDYWDGAMTDKTCSLRVKSFTGTFSNLRIEVRASNLYSNTYIRVRGISLWNYFN